ncbi:cell division protein FtsQ/DivIB [Flavihumibacter stibioxidans]|uniref:Cell division protein FtsQ/DivIB C-terminal domain-containing protein n=1 Tax=Flavihumibacter stibioxidans TaxID=1834163 RepID=A0ABR7M6U6_9BACT|nr:cell division protein FtsQ/DivIB [Flavihumibacter stibioxidans]MBC6490738.1 hypothetical protein [Flavihumibacter stibioxidans]
MRKISTRKVVAAFIWLMAGAGLLVVLIAAINRSDDANCKGVEIEISGTKDYMFIDKSDVLEAIGAKGKNPFRGKPVASFNLRSMETKLAKNSWVQDAELFFDKDRVLQVRIREREPMVRIFTVSGNSWYLDSAGKYLPLSPGKAAVKLPVFTGMPERLKPSGKSDSALLAQIRGIADFLQEDPFWNAQVSQVVVGADRQFELVPLVGNHSIVFGDGNDYEKKFRRLAVFYREVLARTGFDYYDTINVQYDKQVVAVKGSAISTSVDKKIVTGNPTAASLPVISKEQIPASAPSVRSQPERKTALVPKALMKKPNKGNN